MSDDVSVPQMDPEDEGGDPACWLHRVCPSCGRLCEEDPVTTCAGCGSVLYQD